MGSVRGSGDAMKLVGIGRGGRINGGLVHGGLVHGNRGRGGLLGRVGLVSRGGHTSGVGDQPLSSLGVVRMVGSRHGEMGAVWGIPLTALALQVMLHSYIREITKYKVFLREKDMEMLPATKEGILCSWY